MIGQPKSDVGLSKPRLKTCDIKGQTTIGKIAGAITEVDAGRNITKPRVEIVAGRHRKCKCRRVGWSVTGEIDETAGRDCAIDDLKTTRKFIPKAPYVASRYEAPNDTFSLSIGRSARDISAPFALTSPPFADNVINAPTLFGLGI